MKKKYQALRMFAMLHRIVGWLASAAALVVVWVGLHRTLASQPFFDGLFYYFLVAVGIELFGLSFAAYGELLYLFIDIEENIERPLMDVLMDIEQNTRPKPTTT